METIKRLTVISGVLGVVIAAVALTAGLQHNPQGEFYDTNKGTFDFFYAAELFILWFAAVFVVAFSCQLAGVIIYRAIKRVITTTKK